MAGDAVLVGQEPAQEIQAVCAPFLDLDEVLRPAQRRAQHQKQEFRQRVDHLPGLPRVLKGQK